MTTEGLSRHNAKYYAVAPRERASKSGHRFCVRRVR